MLYRKKKGTNIEISDFDEANALYIDVTAIIDGEEEDETIFIDEILDIYDDEEDGYGHIVYMSPEDILSQYDVAVKESQEELDAQIKAVLDKYGLELVNEEAGDEDEYDEDDEDDESKDESEDESGLLAEDDGGKGMDSRISVKHHIVNDIIITLHSASDGHELDFDIDNIESLKEKGENTVICYYTDDDLEQEVVVVAEPFEEVKELYNDAIDVQQEACGKYEVVSSEELARLRKIDGIFKVKFNSDESE